jgi:hypothetical protein
MVGKLNIVERVKGHRWDLIPSILVTCSYFLALEPLVFNSYADGVENHAHMIYYAFETLMPYLLTTSSELHKAHMDLLRLSFQALDLIANKKTVILLKSLIRKINKDPVFNRASNIKLGIALLELQTEKGVYNGNIAASREDDLTF